MWEQWHFINMKLSNYLFFLFFFFFCFKCTFLCDAKMVARASTDLAGRQCYQQHCQQVCMRTDMLEIT